MENFSHDAVLNFLMREEYGPYDLFEQTKPLINLQGGVLSVDDSIWDKPHSNPALNPLVGLHYSGRHHKVVQGICLVTLFFTDTKGARVPVNYRIYTQDGDKTKNELFRDMLDQVLEWGLMPSLVTGDSWYASLENLKWIRRKGLDALFAVEKDRVVSTQKGVYEKVGEAQVPVEGLWTHLKGFGHVTLFRKEEHGQQRHYVYYKYGQQEGGESGKASREEFEQGHACHWNIEEFHRAIKQLCNAAHFLVRRARAVKTHVFAVYRAFVLLEEKVINKAIKNWYEFREHIQTQLIKGNLTQVLSA